MIRDALLCFSGVPTAASPDPTVIIPASATTTVMPESIDTSPLGLPTGSGGGSTSLPNVGRDLGIGGEMWIQVLLATAAASASGTWQCQFITDSDQALATAMVVLLSSPVLSNATMVAALTSGPTSILWRTQLPAGNASFGGAGGTAYKKFIGLQQVVGSAGFTTGTVFAELLTNIQASDQYGSGFLVQ
jgi:hypothetical protein